MTLRTKVVDIEIGNADPAKPVAEGLTGYHRARALVRLYGRPVAMLDMPVSSGGVVTASTLRAHLNAFPQTGLLQTAIANALSRPWKETAAVESVRRFNQRTPLVTVVVCTRNRTKDLAICLDGLLEIDYPNLDLLVVDNASSDDSTEQLVRDHYPQVRYAREPRPGLDWARNRAIIEARGEILAYADDDVKVDPGWVKAFVDVFLQSPDVMCIAGLVVPYELEAEGQLYFETYGGFGRGFTRRWCRVDRFTPGSAGKWIGTGQFGTGANMAYRKSVFDDIGMFDPALDVGTVTNGGGDIEMFFRVIKLGHTLVYEPNAVVRHRHRRTLAELKKQLTDNSSYFAYALRSARAFPDEARTIFRQSAYWFFQHCIKKTIGSIRRPNRFPIDIRINEAKASVTAMFRYDKAKIKAAEILAQYGPQTTEELELYHPQPSASRKSRDAVAVRILAIDDGVTLGIADVADYAATRLYVELRGELIGTVTIANEYADVSVLRLRDEISVQLGVALARLKSDSPGFAEEGVASTAAVPVMSATGLATASLNPPVGLTQPLPLNVTVSIVIPTADRPAALGACLESIVAQKSDRPVEIIVVDNRPESGATAPVASRFPGVRVVNEPRTGLSYALNAGIVSSRGEIIATIDDTSTAPVDWLERLLMPFTRDDVMFVGGGTLPKSLESGAQRLNDSLMPFSSDLKAAEITGRWMRESKYPVRVWQLGSFANAALRAELVRNEAVGLVDEALGPGSPCGGGEAEQFVYKVLAAGFTAQYYPSAYIIQQPADSMPAIEARAFEASKGHAAACLTVWQQFRDIRIWEHLLYRQPRMDIAMLLRSLVLRKGVPPGIALSVLKGRLSGALALWMSLGRVQRLGRTLAASSLIELAPDNRPSA